MDAASVVSTPTPPCSCGNGNMKLKCAGYGSRNPGRFYYKCPLGGDHLDGFHWYDEYHGLGTRWVSNAAVSTKFKILTILEFQDGINFRAYYHRGEPEIYQMCSLFGIHDVKEELSHTVILIEDFSTVNKQTDHKAIKDESSEDEVTSPILKPKKVVSKELFPDDACSTVAPTIPKASKTKMHGPWSAIKNKFSKPTTSTFPARNAFPTKPKDDKNLDAGNGGSSCASWSPFK